MFDELDDALLRFHSLAPEWGGGFSTHGPMACEALGALGHPALIPAMADRYAPRVPPLEEGDVLPERVRGEALGDPERVSDWIATFRMSLASAPWEEVLGEALDRLADGVFAAAGHGLLRTAHAVRALQELDGPIRRGELAHGLGYWSANFERLPGAPGSVGSSSFAEALALLPTASHFDSQRAFTAAAAGLDDNRDYLRAVAAARFRDRGWEEDSHEICAAVLPFYRRSKEARIAATHAITVPAALQLIAPVPDASVRGRLLRSAWQTCVALVSLIPDDGLGGELGDEAHELADNPAELRYRAACSLEEHAIKLTEACLRQAERGASDAFRQVAADAAIHLGADGARVC